MQTLPFYSDHVYSICTVHSIYCFHFTSKIKYSRPICMAVYNGLPFTLHKFDNAKRSGNNFIPPLVESEQRSIDRNEIDGKGRGEG